MCDAQGTSHGGVVSQFVCFSFLGYHISPMVLEQEDSISHLQTACCPRLHNMPYVRCESTDTGPDFSSTYTNDHALRCAIARPSTHRLFRWSPGCADMSAPLSFFMRHTRLQCSRFGGMIEDEGVLIQPSYGLSRYRTGCVRLTPMRSQNPLSLGILVNCLFTASKAV